MRCIEHIMCISSVCVFAIWQVVSEWVKKTIWIYMCNTCNTKSMIRIWDWCSYVVVVVVVIRMFEMFSLQKNKLTKPIIKQPAHPYAIPLLFQCIARLIYRISLAGWVCWKLSVRFMSMCELLVRRCVVTGRDKRSAWGFDWFAVNGQRPNTSVYVRRHMWLENAKCAKDERARRRLLNICPQRKHVALDRSWF